MGKYVFNPISGEFDWTEIPTVYVHESIVSGGGSSAVNTAISDMNALGGGTVILDGSIEMDGDITMMSGVVLKGYGPGTGLQNSTANAYAINFVGATPTWYGISDPADGTSTITTDTPADAGNFEVGDYLILKDNGHASGSNTHFGRVQIDGVVGTGVVKMTNVVVDPANFFTASAQAAPLKSPVENSGMDSMEIINSGAGTITVNIQYSANITIQRTTFIECIIKPDQCGYIRVVDCLFDVDDSTTHASHFEPQNWVSFLSLDGCTFKNSLKGITWGGATSAMLGLEILDCRFYGQQICIYLICIGGQAKSHLQSFKLSGNVFTNNIGTNYAVQSTATMWSCGVYNNLTEKYAQQFYFAPNSFYSAYNNFCGNTIKYSVTMLRQYYLNFSNNYIGGNGTFTKGLTSSNMFSNTFQSTVYLQDGNTQAILSNTVSGNNFVGVVFIEGDSTYVCQKNTFSGNVFGSTVTAYGSIPDNIFTGNYFAGSLSLTNGAGQSADKTLLANNHFSGSITFTEPDQDNCIISDNYVAGSITRLTGTGNKEQSFEYVTLIDNSDSPYTVLDYDHLISCDASGGAITVNLPAVSGLKGREYVIKVTDATNNVTVDANGAETIDGDTTKVINTQYDALHLICNGSEWSIT